MNEGNCSAPSVRSWHGSGAGHGTSALLGHCGRMRRDEARGWYRTEARTVRSAVTTDGTQREVLAGSTLGRWPNHALQRIAARWRLCLS